jgi:prolyl oligopeptidase
VVAPENDAAIANFVVTDKHLFIAELDGGPSRVRILTLDGKPPAAPSLLPLPAVDRMVRGAGDELVFWQESFITPGAYWRWNAGALTKTSLVFATNVDYSDCEAVRRFATSQDGTKVPYTIVRKKGTRADGKNPTLLTGYGAYGISQPPSFRPGTRVFIEQGGVLVVANLRGGGEYGDAWHQAGRLGHKQNVFDDFIAVSKALIADKVTRPDRLAILGGSNGGLLMGAAITQHPELYRASVIQRGILDMVHFDRIPNGVYNSTEFGSPQIPDQLKVLLAYSPLHHIVDATRYPSVLLVTGTNDGRVPPSDSYKMTARLQAATHGGVVLLRASALSGHGMGTKLDERIAELVDTWCFLFRELGVPYTPVKQQASR